MAVAPAPLLGLKVNGSADRACVFAITDSRLIPPERDADAHMDSFRPQPCRGLEPMATTTIKATKINFKKEEKISRPKNVHPNTTLRPQECI
jgi:hypothetical protein